jgi:ferredoxin-NADP reductase/fatty acid desaturase
MWQNAMPEVAWGTICLFLGIILAYVLVISSAVAGIISYPFAALICSYLCFASFTIQHDASHGNIFKMGSPFKFIEDIIGWVASIPLLISPYRLFQKIHDRHHAFTNDPDRDPDHFTFGTKWYQILLSTYYMPIKYHIMSFTTLSHIKIFRDTYASTVIFTLLILSTLIVLVLNGYAIEVLCFSIIPTLITIFFLVMFFDYVPHHPHKSQDRYHNTRIFPSKLLNVLLLGQNYHLIHHMYPRLPWYTYQAVFKSILPDLEANNAPIEDISAGVRPGFMKSPNTQNLQQGGKSINMLLTVAKIERLTPDSVSIIFELPKGEKLNYQAGQYITVSKWLAGEQHVRCYSLCSSPQSNELKIAVRETKKGLVSKYINRDLQVGDELIIQGAFGNFIYPPQNKQSIDSLVLIAGGSGITPILSILETSLAEHRNTNIHLIYGCHRSNNIMFIEKIKALKAINSERLKFDLVISNDRQLSLGSTGRIDKEFLASVLPMISCDGDSCKAGTQHTNNKTCFYICGPEGLRTEVIRTLESNSIPSEHIHTEEFSTLCTKALGKLHKIDITLADGQKHRLNVASNQTILEVAKLEGVIIPHACSAGSCGSCKFKVDKGTLDNVLDSVPGITFAECDNGYTLLCQCKPQSDLELSCI